VSPVEPDDRSRFATVIGPVPGALPPFGSPSPALVAERGYVVEEYQLEGETVAYETDEGTTLGVDGRWQVSVAGEAPYRTRILVVRPADPDRFNGTIVLNWQNVSAGFESGSPAGDELFSGYAWVGVSAQEVGLFGFPFGMDRGGGGPGGRPLVDADPERYGQLAHPGDPGAYEMFTQAAWAVGPGRNGPVDPMGGLVVERIVATGASQSAMRLVCYFNAVHPLVRVVDGVLLSVWEGRAPRPEEGPVSMGVRTRVRDDLTTPVLVVNSEFEVPHLASVGAVDGPALRIWEVAGTPHAPQSPGRANSRGWEPNPLGYGTVYQSALRWMQGWLLDGRVPPHQPRVEVDPGPAPRVRRDGLGNAIGGIRLPELAVPTREYRGMAMGSGRPPLFGASKPFDDDVVRALYPSRAAYLQRWNDAVDAIVESGAIRFEDTARLKARGEAVELPL
jgi:hypothetical protein